MKHYRQLAGLHRFFSSIENQRLSRNKPTRINQVWAGDITYLKVNKQWRYLATVKGVYSRRIISWSLSNTKNTKLTIGVLEKAIKKRQPEEDVIFHTGRGS